MDDFNIDVTPLTSAERSEPRSPVVAHLGHRGRLLRVGGILGALLLTSAILVAVTPWARSGFVRLVTEPSPTATTPLAAGADAFAVEHQLPWGSLTIDGRDLTPVTRQASTNDEGQPGLATFHLSRGHHQLDYRADPMPILRCIVSVPAAATDTCPIDPTVIDYLVSTGRFTRLLDLEGTPDHLTGTPRSDLADATQAALTLAASEASGALTTGDHYLDAHSTVVTATEALHAEPTYTLRRDLSADPGTHCAVVCVNNLVVTQASADDWQLYALVDVSWRYRNAAGQVVLADGPPMPPVANQPMQVAIGVHLEDSAWRVHVRSVTAAGESAADPLSCLLGAHALDVLLYSPTQTILDPTDPSYRWQMATLAETGCALEGWRYDTEGTRSGPEMLVLYRYGVLTAVTDEAHRVFPHLPWASVHERALAPAALSTGVSAAGFAT